MYHHLTLFFGVFMIDKKIIRSVAEFEKTVDEVNELLKLNDKVKFNHVDIIVDMINKKNDEYKKLLARCKE